MSQMPRAVTESGYTTLRTKNHRTVRETGIQLLPYLFGGREAYFDTHLVGAFKQAPSQEYDGAGKKVIIGGQEFYVFRGPDGQKLLYDGKSVVGIVKPTAVVEIGTVKRLDRVYSTKGTFIARDIVQTGVDKDGVPVFSYKTNDGLPGNKTMAHYKVLDNPYRSKRITGVRKDSQKPVPSRPKPRQMLGWDELMGELRNECAREGDEGRIMRAFYIGAGEEALRFDDTDAFVLAMRDAGLLLPKGFKIHTEQNDRKEDRKKPKKQRNYDEDRTGRMIESFLRYDVAETVEGKPPETEELQYGKTLFRRKRGGQTEKSESQAFALFDRYCFVDHIAVPEYTEEEIDAGITPGMRNWLKERTGKNGATASGADSPHDGASEGNDKAEVSRAAD